MKMTMVKSGLKGSITIVASMNHMVNIGQKSRTIWGSIWYTTLNYLHQEGYVLFVVSCFVLFLLCFVCVSVRPHNYGTGERICMKFFSEACRGPRTNPLNLGEGLVYDPDPASGLRSLISVEVSSLWLTVLYLIKYEHFFVHIHTSG